MYFTAKQIKSSTQIVELYHSKFILEQAGLDALTVSEKKLLQTNGVDLTIYKGKRTPIEESYLFGRAESSVRNKRGFNRLDLKAFREFMDQNQGLFELTTEDKKTVKLAKQAFANDIRRLSNDIKHDLEQKLIEVSKITTAKTSKKRILKTLSVALAENTKRYSSRFELISGYNCHSAFQEGIAGEILQRLVPNARVYYSVHKDACPYCKKVYLKPNGEPKVFLLKTVIGNGNNIGRKGKQYKASVQPLHPRCRCKMNLLPKGKVKWSAKQNHYIRIFK